MYFLPKDVYRLSLKIVCKSRVPLGSTHECREDLDLLAQVLYLLA